MRLGKNKDHQGITPEQELEQKVDAMMDVRRSDPAPEEVFKPSETAQQVDTTLPEIDIFAEAKTAPEVPNELKKQLHLSHVKKTSEKKAAEVSATTKEAADKEVEEKTETLRDPFDDPATDKAVDEITKEESDALLQYEDEKSQSKSEEPVKQSLKQKIKTFFAAWWANKWARWGTIAAVVLLLIGTAVWPTSRYFILNMVGVRSSASLKVIDQSSGMPLKNVTVSLGTEKTKTNGDGVAAFQRVKLGSQELRVERVAFAPVVKKITIGWGSNPLPMVELKAVGAQYVFHLTDYLSGKPITEAEVISGDASAFADKEGKAILTLDNPETDTIEATVKSKEYRMEKFSFAATTKSPFDVRMVPVKPVVYVSKQSGKYDLYKVDVDGKNKQLLLAGTGSERREISIATSPDGAYAALVSSRGTKRDANQYLLDTLTLVDIKSGQATVIDDAANIKLIDWVGERLVYVATYSAPSAAYAQRQRLVAYNVEESARNTIAVSDYFNGVASINNTIYYVVAPSDPSSQPGFYKVKVDGSSKQSIINNKHIATLVRISESVFALEAPEGWYEYEVGDHTASKSNAPADPYTNRQYVTAPGGGKSAWVDVRDGKGVLLLHEKGNDKTIVTASGLTTPIQWLNKTTILYRVSNTNETAEYVVSINGGEPKKITDVTATAGLLINY